MVKSKEGLKKEVKRFIQEIKTQPFTTSKVREHAQLVAPNIKTSKQRLTKYIIGTGEVDFDKKNHQWKDRITTTVRK